MTHAGTPVVSAPDRERTARAPVVVPATATGTGGAPAMRETVTPPEHRPDPCARTRGTGPVRSLSRVRRGQETSDAAPDTTIPKNRRPRA